MHWGEWRSGWFPLVLYAFFLVYLLNLSPVAQRWSTAHHASYDNGAEGILEVLGPLVIWRQELNFGILASRATAAKTLWAPLTGGTSNYTLCFLFFLYLLIRFLVGLVDIFFYLDCGFHFSFLDIVSINLFSFSHHFLVSLGLLDIKWGVFN